MMREKFVNPTDSVILLAFTNIIGQILHNPSTIPDLRHSTLDTLSTKHSALLDSVANAGFSHIGVTSNLFFRHIQVTGGVVEATF